jgi:hypothetical protein
MIGIIPIIAISVLITHRTIIVKNLKIFASMNLLLRLKERLLSKGVLKVITWLGDNVEVIPEYKIEKCQ